MIDKEQFADEFADLAYQAGITETCALEFPEYMYRRNEDDPRSFAEVDPHALYFAFAPQVLDLDWQHRRGLIMHELGHILCCHIPGGGSERDADLAAEECFGERIIYDKTWPGKGLQCVRGQRNPPYSGYDPRYPQRKGPPDPTKISYRKKRDALNVFLDWNASIIDDAFSGPTALQTPESFDNFNRFYDLKGKRLVNNLAKALWWALPSGSPYYLEDINIEMLNETAPMIHNVDRELTIPDYAEEARLIAQEQEYYEQKYGGVFPDGDEEIPF